MAAALETELVSEQAWLYWELKQTQPVGRAPALGPMETEPRRAETASVAIPDE